MSAFSALDMINPKARQQAAAVREYKEIYLNPKEVKDRKSTRLNSSHMA